MTYRIIIIQKDGSEIGLDNIKALILHEESDMSRLSDDEKRYFTDQISMLKNENERLTKYAEDLSKRNAELESENERLHIFAEEHGE